MKRAFPWLFMIGVGVHLALHALPPSWAGGFGVGSGGLQGTSGGGGVTSAQVLAALAGQDLSVNSLTVTTTGVSGITFTDGNSVQRITWGSGQYMQNFSSTGRTLLTGGVSSATNATTCTLNGASPSTCTATVSASAVCTAIPVGTTAAAGAVDPAVNLSGTTLTVTAANGATNAVNIWCDR